MENTTRNASLQDLAALLTQQQARKLDLVVPANRVMAQDGRLIIAGTEPVIDTDGVTLGDGAYLPTAICDEGISDKLGIPLPYLRRLRSDHVGLYDQNVNGWLFRQDRNFLVRCFKSDDGGDGIARAFLSDRFGIIDNLDALTAALDGVKEAGVDVKITGCDLTDRKMYVKVAAPQVEALAPDLLDRYRAPDGRMGRDDPRVFAGFVISNSEVGGGAFTIVPRITVLVCSNGLVREKDAMRQVHMGARMDQGVIRWTEDTQRKNLDLITAQARDAVATFLDVDYVKGAVDELTTLAGRPVMSDTVQTVTKRLNFSAEQTKGVLDFFITGADVSAGGVMQAITAYAQTVDDADEAFALEAAAIPAMELAASR